MIETSINCCYLAPFFFNYFVYLWFLYDNDLRLERVKVLIFIFISQFSCISILALSEFICENYPMHLFLLPDLPCKVELVFSRKHILVLKILIYFSIKLLTFIRHFLYDTIFNRSTYLAYQWIFKVDFKFQKFHFKVL